MTTRATHPGVILKEEFLAPLGITKYAVSQATGVSQTSLKAITDGRRAITPTVALRLSRYLGTSDSYWITLQSDYDMRVARDSSASQLDGISVHPRVAHILAS